MASLQWIGKEAVVGHHREVPYHLLRGDPALSVGEDGGVGSGNLLVQGDNLLALKALLPYYAGRVKCIYIDPPYNTGNEGWVYNDNTNSAEMRQWIGKVVGKEGETLDRHDRWLCMMYPRLALLKEFLTENGAIFVSIDDNEVQNLRGVMDEVFGRKNFVATVIWQKNYAPKASAKHFSEDHDYVVVYAKHAETWGPNLMPRTEKQDKMYKNYDDDPRGFGSDGADHRQPDQRQGLRRPRAFPDGPGGRPGDGLRQPGLQSRREGGAGEVRAAGGCQLGAAGVCGREGLRGRRDLNLSTVDIF